MQLFVLRLLVRIWWVSQWYFFERLGIWCSVSEIHHNRLILNSAEKLFFTIFCNLNGRKINTILAVRLYSEKKRYIFQILSICNIHFYLPFWTNLESFCWFDFKNSYFVFTSLQLQIILFLQIIQNTFSTKLFSLSKVKGIVESFHRLW